MRLPRSSVPQIPASRCSLLSSWRSVGLILLGVTQLLTLCLLLNLAGREQRSHPNTDTAYHGPQSWHGQAQQQQQQHQQPQQPQQQQYNRQEQQQQQQTHLKPELSSLSTDVGEGGGGDVSVAQPEPTLIQRPADYMFTVVRNDLRGAEAATTARKCVSQAISAGQCSNEKRRLEHPQQLRRDTCTFDLEASDIVFGVWHSLATEGRLQPLLDTWGANANIVLLASTVGARESKLFEPGAPGSKPHLLDTGILEDDYFSTLGKAFIGLRLMLEAYPSKKWFVVLGDDNYVLMDNYVNVLSAFDPEQPWALSRIVFRDKFGCKVAGGASVITSRAMTQELSPHLEPWYQGIVERSGGDVTKAAQEDKFHDISFQKLVESVGHSWVHLDELPHEPPGSYFASQPPFKRASIPARSALFHYVPGRYMHYLHFVSSQICTCTLETAELAAALSEVAVGVYSSRRRLSKLDEKRIAATWGQTIRNYRLLQASGKDAPGLRGDVERIRELVEAFPKAGWFMLLPVNHYVVPANLAVRIRKLDERKEEGARGVMISGPGGRYRREEADSAPGAFVDFEDGALLLGRDLATTVLKWGEALPGGIFPTHRRPGDREIYAWARTINRSTVLEDPGLVRGLPAMGEGAEGGTGGRGAVGCPATLPMEPDLADLKPEFTLSEGDAVMMVTQFLLHAVPENSCMATQELPPRIST